MIAMIPHSNQLWERKSSRAKHSYEPLVTALATNLGLDIPLSGSIIPSLQVSEEQYTAEALGVVTTWSDWHANFEH